MGMFDPLKHFDLAFHLEGHQAEIQDRVGQRFGRGQFPHDVHQLALVTAVHGIGWNGDREGTPLLVKSCGVDRPVFDPRDGRKRPEQQQEACQK